MRDFVRLVLETAGYEVECASDGLEGLQVIDAHPPDLVILDLMMPVMDGWQVLARTGHHYPPVIVVLSAACDPDRARREGAADAVSKPFRPHELIATCRRVLGE